MGTLPTMPQPNRGRQRQKLLALILALLLLRGLLYLVVFPPWQHYDEPTHFEYIRLIADRARLPQEGDYDLEMRREIAASMRETGFWSDSGNPPIDFWSTTPPDIGMTELVHPPLYYMLLAVLQPLVAHQGIGLQLYLARLGSLLLATVVVTSAFGLTAEVFPQRRMLPVAVAAFVGLLPPFMALMSSVNNDVGAATASSLLLWATVRMVRRGASLWRWVGVLLLSGACVATKSTASIVTAAVLLVLGGGYLYRAVLTPKARRWFWLGLVLLGLVFLVAAFTWGEQAAFWEGRGQTSARNRLAADAVLGRSVLVLSNRDDRGPRLLFQELAPEDGQRLQGRMVTLGAWLRTAEGPDGPVVLSLADGSSFDWQRVQAGSDWKFHAFAAEVAPDAPTVTFQVSLPASEDVARVVLLDGLVLAEGDLAGSSAPEFDSAAATSGSWAGRAFENRLRNGSAESAWPGLRAWLGEVKLFRYPVTFVFHSLWDLERTGWVYGPDLLMLAQSFWGRLGWNHLALPQPYFVPLLLLTLAGIAGAVLALLRWFKRGGGRVLWRLHVLAILGAALLVGWGGAMLRIHPVLATSGILWPVARYAVVVLAPTAMLLCTGWAELVPRRWLREAAWIGLLALIVLDAIVLWIVVLPYYYG
jgi:hypothetical protein